MRRVDYRRGSHDDLAKIHLVESEVEAERRPDNTPLPLDRFITEAHAFPPYFHEWSLLFETLEGEPAATGAAWFREGDDPDWLEFDAWVRRPWRRQGIATRVLQRACEIAEAEGRTRLLTYTTDCAPSGESFIRRFGFEPVRTSRRSELVLDRVDWNMVRTWVDDGPRRAAGYRLDFVDGAYPEANWDDAVALRLMMNTAPHDDIEKADREYTRDQVAQDDAWILDSGKSRWTYFARDAATGECVGGTNVYLSPWNAAVVEQGDTGVHPDHRGHALGKWLKAAMLERIRAELPLAAVVRTGNAYSNAPMLGINDALGFAITRTLTEWAADVSTVRTRATPQG
jgi:GNAT superfamily N-acetyltransferase